MIVLITISTGGCSRTAHSYEIPEEALYKLIECEVRKYGSVDNLLASVNENKDNDYEGERE